jgi:hypothetical protein
LDVFVERIDENPERQIALELRRRSRKYELPKRIGASSNLGEETRLADPRFAPNLKRSRPAPVELGKSVIDLDQLVSAPNKVLRTQSHVSTRRG